VLDRQRLQNPFDDETGRYSHLRSQLGTTPRWKLAERLLAAGKWADAERVLEEALQVEWQPGGADLMADVESQRGQPAKAVQLLSEVIYRDAPSLHYLERLGDANVAADRAEAARLAWERAVRFGSLAERKDVHSKLYLLYEKQGDELQARRHRALAFLAAGCEALENDHVVVALAALEKSTDIEPLNSQTWFYLGEASRMKGAQETAAKAYDRCLSLNPRHGRARTGRSLLQGHALRR
jgi:tetratricopeptide (TPR) repeat protein